MLCEIILLIPVFQSRKQTNRALKFFKYSGIRDTPRNLLLVNKSFAGTNEMRVGDETIPLMFPLRFHAITNKFLTEKREKEREKRNAVK